MAACAEGSGSRAYELFMQDVKTVEEVFDKFSRQEFAIGPHKAFQFARELKRINVILVSQLPADQVKNLLLTPADNLDEAFRIALAQSPTSQPEIACMPLATSTIPFIQD